VAKTATYMMMLTNSMELIATEKVVDGELYICQRHTKEMIVSALKHGAALVVLAHNHPNGPCYDTQDDHFALNFIRSAFQNAGIYFIENYVISGSGYFSSMGKIDTLYLSQSPEVEQFLKEKEIMPNVYVAVRP
jgi:DNA repair protein RadC